MPDTIFALSTGAPPAAIAIVRISGPDGLHAATILAGRLPEPRVAGLRILRDPATATVLDRAIVLVFPGPNTATGEDLVELHLHGGRAVVRAVENALGQMPRLRGAEPGEFTRRALANGRIDLTEAEGLADLLAAETESQRRAAMMNAEGGLRRLVEQWTSRVVGLAASLEAAIDHEDEGDVDEAAIIQPVREGAGALASEIDAVLAQPRSERLHDGVRVVLAGPPNSGKSTLFNTLVDRDAAIVSPIAGTTRDRIEAPVGRGGVAWLFIDTAGLASESDDVIERVGIDRAHDAMRSADIVIWLGDDDPHDAEMLAITARADLVERQELGDRLHVSAKSGLGMSELWDVLVKRAEELLPPVDSVALNQRQASVAARASEALREAGNARDPLLVAEELRTALMWFDRLSGRAGIENVLDDLFGRFCIGK